MTTRLHDAIAAKEVGQVLDWWKSFLAPNKMNTCLKDIKIVCQYIFFN